MKLQALIAYVLSREPYLISEKLAWICFHADMEAYRHLGKPVTGDDVESAVKWCKGNEIPFPQGSDEGWARRAVLARQPMWARAAGLLIALWAATR